MKIIEVKNRTEKLINDLVIVWEDAVKATHQFLSNEEIISIKKFVIPALKEIKHLIIMENDQKKAIAFMGIEQRELEMLFIKKDEIGKGYGKLLLNFAIEKYSIMTLTVNEQNFKAKGFYEHMGFKTYKRESIDKQGNPYPILYMKLDK